jgi:hypothetical protein
VEVQVEGKAGQEAHAVIAPGDMRANPDFTGAAQEGCGAEPKALHEVPILACGMSEGKAPISSVYLEQVCYAAEKVLEGYPVSGGFFPTFSPICSFFFVENVRQGL